MKNNMSNHMVFLIFLLLYRRKRIRIILNYINTVGEEISGRVAECTRPKS
jgi:hypothetical protein